MQALREDIRRVDAVLFTHAHADHLFGLDDIRRFNDLSGAPMPCHGSEDTIRTVRAAFEYVFVPTQLGGGKPSINLMSVDGPFEASGVPVTPIPVMHGQMPILGYRIGDLVYITDCSRIPASSYELMRGIDTLVLGVIRHEPHETHFSISDGLAVVEKLKPRQTFFTHIAHRLDHEATNNALPADVQLAYDGQHLEIRD